MNFAPGSARSQRSDNINTDQGRGLTYAHACAHIVTQKRTPSVYNSALSSGKMKCSIIVGVLLICSAFAAEVEFSYDAQDEWPGICVTGNQIRQSPIDIITDDVEDNEDLIDLELSGWDTGYDGVFVNSGHNVQFNPDTPSLATVRNHLGTYQVQQFHMHWGSTTGQGSEHRVNGNQAELEIHFVQFKSGEDDTTAGDYASVISVLADVDTDAPITGVWEQLGVVAVQPYNANVSVENIRFDQLLPEDLDYWYYEGSLTTPLCNEVVVWFLLKERITVPGAFLSMLRGVQEDEQGTLLTFNFRMAQEIGDRTVYEQSGAPTIRATLAIFLLIAALVSIKLF